MCCRQRKTFILNFTCVADIFLLFLALLWVLPCVVLACPSIAGDGRSAYSISLKPLLGLAWAVVSWLLVRSVAGCLMNFIFLLCGKQKKLYFCTVFTEALFCL